MLKTIEEITRDAEFAQYMIAYHRGSAKSHRADANVDDAEAIKWQRELDDIERQLIAATGEAS